MESSVLWAGAMKLILMISPFLAGYLAIVYANEIIGLLTNAILGRRRDYD
jgi:hypothetical protein